MNLNGQAERATTAVLAEAGMTTTDDVTMRLLKMAWLDGYKRGMDAAQALAVDAITKALS